MKTQIPIHKLLIGVPGREHVFVVGQKLGQNKISNIEEDLDWRHKNGYVSRRFLVQVETPDGHLMYAEDITQVNVRVQYDTRIPVMGGDQ